MKAIWKTNRAINKRAVKMEQMDELREQIQHLLDRQNAYEEQMTDLHQSYPIQRSVDYEDIVTVITSGEQIQLESYRSIPEFNGNKNQYRSWRNQVTRRMNMIANFKAHPKYEAALGIIRAKITGAASDVLTNNKTAYNIDAIIARLDTTYADQRPLYIIEAEMTSIKQLNKSLQEFYDEINQALNLVISKIVLSYPTLNEQKPLVVQAQQKAIRTFIIGLRSQASRNILYGHDPKTLAEALTIAQTVYYDNQYLQLDQSREMPKYKAPNFPKNSLPGMQRPMHAMQQPLQKTSTGFNVNMNCNSQPFQAKAYNKPEPMEVDNSNRFKQTTNWRPPNQPQNTQMNGPQKREYDSSRQNLQQPNKVQRINQLQDGKTDVNEGYEGDVCDTIPEDLISNASNESTTSSAFLEE